MVLYYITGRQQLPGDEDVRRQRLLTLVEAAALSGVDYIQLRENDLSPKQIEDLSRQAKQRIARSGGRAKLLVNSLVEVVISAGADGVHLRSTDMSAAEARKKLLQAGMNHALVAVSCHTREEVARAQSEGADFVVFGPVFEKNGEKNGAAVAGLASLTDACAAATIPVLALGGVSVINATSCIAHGAAGVAGIRLFQAGDLASAVKELRSLE